MRQSFNDVFLLYFSGTHEVSPGLPVQSAEHSLHDQSLASERVRGEWTLSDSYWLSWLVSSFLLRVSLSLSLFFHPPHTLIIVVCQLAFSPYSRAQGFSFIHVSFFQSRVPTLILFFALLETPKKIYFWLRKCFVLFLF